MKQPDSPILGIIPAGGRASRLGRQPRSKEILPVGLPTNSEGGRQGVASDCLLESFASAGVTSAYFILAPGKWDIPEHFGAVTQLGLHLGYLIRQHPYGVPFTIDSAYPFAGRQRVAFGFPDILFRPVHAITQLTAHQRQSEADVVLGVFPVDEPEKWDAVELGASGVVKRVHPKPHESTTGLTWILAVWSPTFTLFLHEFVYGYDLEALSGEAHQDVSLGVVIQAAIESQLSVESVTFEDGVCLDIGTPHDLEKARTSGWWTSG